MPSSFPVRSRKQPGFGSPAQLPTAQRLLSTDALGQMPSNVISSPGPVLQLNSDYLDHQSRQIVSALSCGVPSKENWALNTLGLLSFKNTLVLSHVSGLLEGLLQIVQRGLSTNFRYISQTYQEVHGLFQVRDTQGVDSPQPAHQQLPHILSNETTMEHYVQAAAAASQVLYNAAVAGCEENQTLLLSKPCLHCWIQVLEAALGTMKEQGSSISAGDQSCWHPFMHECALNVIHLLETSAAHVRSMALDTNLPAQVSRVGVESEECKETIAAYQELLLHLLDCLVQLVSPLALPTRSFVTCIAALDTLAAWAVPGIGDNSIWVQRWSSSQHPRLLSKLVELLETSYDEIRYDAEAQMIEEGDISQNAAAEDFGFDMVIDVVAMITQAQIFSAASQLLLHLVSSQCKEVRCSVPDQSRLIQIIAAVATHEHPRLPASWQNGSIHANQAGATQERILSLFSYRSAVLKKARLHATTILASLAFDPATRHHVAAFERHLVAQIASGRVPADGPMHALLAALCHPS